MKKLLVLGCGNKNIKEKFPNYEIVTIDLRDNVGASIVHNLEVFPWPIEDNTFDYVLAEQILEHLKDTTRTLEEIYRISKPNSQVEITVPYFRSKWNAIDPTHVKQFCPWSIYHYVPNARLGRRKIQLYENYQLSKTAKFHMNKFSWNKDIDQTIFQKILIKISDINLEFYEDKLAPMFPLECMTWELKVLK